MIIGSIVNGIVIDHIPAGRGMELYNSLELKKLDCEVALIKNASSVKLGKKDILKIGELIPLNYDILAYIDPKITVNVIEEGKLIRKTHPELPDTIKGIIKCKNPRCITSTEQELLHVFKLTNRENSVYRCIYCETKAEQNRMRS